MLLIIIKYERKKKLSIKEYFNIIRPYLGIITNDHKTKGECKIQLSITINFISSKDSDGICTMHIQSNNMEIMMRNETDEILEELFKSL